MPSVMMVKMGHEPEVVREGDVEGLASNGWDPHPAAGAPASRRFPVYSGTERVAFVIESAVGRVLVQAWVVLTPRMCPNRAFDNEAKSVDWLLS